MTERTGTPLVESLLAGRVPAPTLQAARKAWLRSRRSPVALLSGLSPYLVPAVFAVQFGTEGRPPAWTMYGFAGAGVAATGTLFALNPIGDEERVLPVTLTSVADWRAFLAGLVLVSWAVGVPLTVGVTVAVGLATGVDPSLVIAAALFAGALGVAAPGLALAAGVEYPSFETESLPGGPEVVEPSFAALVAMLAVAGLAASPLVLTVALGGHGRILVTASGLLSVVLAVLAGRAGFRYAVERFDGYVPSREQL